MAGFRVHAITAFAVSVSFASYITISNHFPLPWGGVLCALGFVGGLLPDIDSGEARMARYSGLMVGVVSSLVASLLFLNFFIAMLLFVPFAKLAHLCINKWTTHRGVFHSVPMGLLLSLGVFYIAELLEFPHPFCLYAAAFLGGGYLVHLTLDEVWSLRKGITTHSSFGTAIQFFRMAFWKSFLATYAFLAVAIYRTPFLKDWIRNMQFF